MIKKRKYHLTVRTTYDSLYTDEHIATFIAQGDAALAVVLFNTKAPKTHRYFISPIKINKP